MSTALVKVEPIQLPANPAQMPSLPGWLRQRSAALTNVVQPDQTGKHREMPVLPQNLIPDSSERAVISRHVTELSVYLDISQPFTHRGQVLTNDQAHAAIIVGILQKGGRKLDQTASDSLTEDYLDAIEDLPAWCVREAIRKWNRGESQQVETRQPHNFSFRPEPPVLRKLAYLELYAVKGRVLELQRVLDAVPLIEYSAEHCAKMREKLQSIGIKASAAA